jgi:hypothetical protein
MTSKFTRNARLRRRRADGASYGDLAREFAIARTTVKAVLLRTGGDPLAGEREGDALRDDELDAAVERLRHVVATTRRTLRDCEARLTELEAIAESRGIDRILGLTG